MTEGDSILREYDDIFGGEGDLAAYLEMEAALFPNPQGETCRVTVDMPSRLVDAIDVRAARSGASRQEAICTLLAEALEDSA